MEYHGAGIYGLYNVVKDKIYIGASSDIGHRFSSHRSNFRTHSGSNPMYKEPLEHFVFLVLRKMTDEEYAKYGYMMEQLFIERAEMDYMRVYNKNSRHSAICRVFEAFDMYDTIQDEIRKACGTRRCWLKQMNAKSRQDVLDKMRRENA